MCQVYLPKFSVYTPETCIHMTLLFVMTYCLVSATIKNYTLVSWFILQKKNTGDVHLLCLLSRKLSPPQSHLYPALPQQSPGHGPLEGPRPHPRLLALSSFLLSLPFTREQVEPVVSQHRGGDSLTRVQGAAGPSWGPSRREGLGQGVGPESGRGLNRGGACSGEGPE